MASTKRTPFAAALVSLFIVCGLAACGHDGHTGAARIPFIEAQVSPTGATTATLAWRAPGAGTVALYSGTDPDHIEHTEPVADGGESGSTELTGLGAAPRRYFQLVPANGATLVVADRSLHLASAPNFRDAGGYRTTDGKWIRMGLLYRSDQLDKLSPGDLETLHSIGLKLVCDLRTDTERQQGMDRLPPGAEPLIADVAGPNSASSDLGKLLSKGGDAQALLGNGKAAQFLIDANRQFVESASAKQAYRLMFERLADPRMLPGVFHCSAGKDRTGWAAAIFLSIMGVPRETIMQDYLLSNTYLAGKNAKLLAALKGRIDPALLQPLLDVRPEYLQAAFDAVDKDYGSMDRYVRDGLGLSDTTIQALRNEFLEG